MQHSLSCPLSSLPLHLIPPSRDAVGHPPLDHREKHVWKDFSIQQSISVSHVQASTQPQRIGHGHTSHTDTHAHTHTHTHTHSHARRHAQDPAHLHTHTQARTHARTHTSRHIVITSNISSKAVYQGTILAFI